MNTCQVCYSRGKPDFYVIIIRMVGGLVQCVVCLSMVGGKVQCVVCLSMVGGMLQ